MSSLQLQENDLLSCRKYSCVKNQFWPVSGPMSSISVLLILGLEIVDLELQVVHLSEPPYPRDVEALGSLRWKKLCWGGSSSAPAPSPLTGGIPSAPPPEAQARAPAISSSHTHLSPVPPRRVSSSEVKAGLIFLCLSQDIIARAPAALHRLFYLLILSSLFILRATPLPGWTSHMASHQFLGW